MNIKTNFKLKLSFKKEMSLKYLNYGLDPILRGSPLAVE
jgi:hypothetical protein